MVEGKVKFFNRKKNFGFVVADDGNEYFVHRSDIEGEVNLEEEDRVTFEIEEGDRGPKAVQVKKA